MDTGHFIDRRWEPLKFNLLNLEVQCRRCNRYLDGNLISYQRQLITKHGGPWIVKFLEESKYTMRSLNRDEVKWLISYLRTGIKSKLLF